MICVSPKLFPFISLLKVFANKESAYKEIPGQTDRQTDRQTENERERERMRKKMRERE